MGSIAEDMVSQSSHGNAVFPGSVGEKLDRSPGAGTPGMSAKSIISDCSGKMCDEGYDGII
jgi:hypothetical protein